MPERSARAGRGLLRRHCVLAIDGGPVTEIELDETHDPARMSWVESANRPDVEFPIQNLPYCVFRRNTDDRAQIGVAIGEMILNVAGLASRLDGKIEGAAGFLSAPSLA